MNSLVFCLLAMSFVFMAPLSFAKTANYLNDEDLQSYASIAVSAATRNGGPSYTFMDGTRMKETNRPANVHKVNARIFDGRTFINCFLKIELTNDYKVFNYSLRCPGKSEIAGTANMG